MFEREARTSPVEQGSEPGDSSTLAPGRVTFLDDGPLPPVAVGTEQPPAPTASELAFDGAHGDAIARPHPTPARRVADRGAKQAAGRLPQNHELAGKQFPADLLPAKYRAKGVKFTPEGYPDFAPHAKQLPNGKTSVEIEYTGSRRADYAAANRKGAALSGHARRKQFRSLDELQARTQ